MIVVSGTIQIDTSKGVNFKEAAKQATIETNKELGCLKYIISADLENQSIFYIFEEWENQEMLNAHLQKPHMAEFGKKIGPVMVREGTRFQNYHVDSVQPM